MSEMTEKKKSAGQVRVEQMKVQGLCEPIGIGTRQPVFSYIVKERPQGAFRLLAASARELLRQDVGDLWDSGICTKSETFGIVYEGKELASRQKVYWKVMVWDREGNPLGQSDISCWEMGLLHKEDWKGTWIGQGDDYKGDKSIAPMLMKEFHVDKCILNNEMSEKGKDVGKGGSRGGGRLYISGLGLFQATLNGHKLSDNLFEPGESDATKTVYYVVYDVTDKLREGSNVLQVTLGNGQYTNFQVNPVMANPDGTLLAPHRYQKNDGGFVKPGISGDKKLIAQLEVTDHKGERRLVIASDESWRWKNSPTVFQNWYGGEDYDATLEEEEWQTDSQSVKRMNAPDGVLTAREFPPIHIVERITPKDIKRLPGGRWLVDMGRNGAGFPEIMIDTTEQMRGQWIKMYPAELLKTDGSGVNQASCTQSWSERFQCVIQDAYRIRGRGKEKWHPSFCYQGFQYVEVEGWPGELKKENIRYCIVRTANEKTGSFLSSKPGLNAVSSMVEHSMESNMFGAFTDCPQIEKLGWIETSHLMFQSLADCYDIQAWMRKIIYDIADSQVDEKQALLAGNEPAGYVPAIIPEFQRIVGLHRDPNWNGACIFTPWEYYNFYGDIRILEKMYPVMEKYIQYLSAYVKNGVLADYAQMGEWGELSETTPRVLVATCSYYRMLTIMTSIAKLLGKENKETAYSRKACETRRAFHENIQCFQSDTGIYGSGSQASYGCVLFSDIVLPENRKAAVDKLVQAVRDNDYHLTSGEVGLKQVFTTLAENGRNDIVYRMVMNKTAPSYAYFAEAGFTTLPEYWNCDELWCGMERSRNHAMMGHVKEWMSRYMLGIKPLEPAYKKVRIAPYLPEDVDWLEGRVLCPFGEIWVKCTRDGAHQIITQVKLPPGVEAVKE